MRRFDGACVSRHLFRRLAHRLAPQSKVPDERIVYAVRRAKDGLWWAGEYKWQGKTFTSNLRNRYLWGSDNAAKAAVDANGLRNVEVVPLPMPKPEELGRRTR